MFNFIESVSVHNIFVEIKVKDALCKHETLENK